LKKLYKWNTADAAVAKLVVVVECC